MNSSRMRLVLLSTAEAKVALSLNWGAPDGIVLEAVTIYVTVVDTVGETVMVDVWGRGVAETRMMRQRMPINLKCNCIFMIYERTLAFFFSSGSDKVHSLKMVKC